MSTQHCVVTAPAGSCADSQISGDAFDLQLRSFVQGESVTSGMSELGEEVGAIVEGSFDVFAADESYSLSAGEAIIIPPHEPRRWVCTSAQGLLYRAVVRLGATREHEL